MKRLASPSKHVERLFALVGQKPQGLVVSYADVVTAAVRSNA